MARGKHLKLVPENREQTQQLHLVYTDYKSIAQWWMLNILIPLGAHKSLILEQHCHSDDVLHELDLSELANAIPFSGTNVRTALKQLHNEMSSSAIPKVPSHTQLAKNIQWLAKAIGLNSTEQAILHFRVVASRHLPLRSCLDHMGNCIDQLFTIKLLARLLGEPESEVEEALRPSAKLLLTGLLSISNRLSGVMERISLLNGLADSLYGVHTNPYTLFKGNFTEADTPRLSKDDYPHLKEDIAILESYLLQALENKQPGVNVLIYGTPGSGKTEFVKMLAHEIGRPLFEVATENSAGAPILRANRFRSFRLSQHILATNDALPLILFDEVEDVFRSGPNDDEDEKDSGNPIGMKGWINKLLEGNSIPSFWLSNNLGCLDKAFVRRFDYIIELNAPPRSVRSKILDQYLEGVDVSASWKANMAEHEHLNPAVIERAAKVIECMTPQKTDMPTEVALNRILGNTLEALGLPRSPKGFSQPVTGYRLEILNTDTDISDVCKGLSEHGEGRLCLYGPPGTGKTAFGRYLAESLDRPLMVRRASDILGPYVGMTEHNMAKMFREADEENAVLLLDEADTFLRDRNGATRSWEVSEVNEMLTQMESFEGIFIASTNLMESLDAAALRRFDLKVKFDYLKPEQAWMIFKDTAEKFDLEVDDRHRLALDTLRLLTPGDFANVTRQSRLRKIESADILVSLLTAECTIKPGAKLRKIGF
jgi:SpoVK/Ycf46/Vps4 family AAA+-type ATPase